MADVSERHEAQERQRLSASLFEHLHEGLLIADADLRVLDANPAYTQILGVPLAEPAGHACRRCCGPSPTDPLARQQRAAMWAGLRQTRPLARRADRAPAQRRDLHAAGHDLPGARAPKATCATTCWRSPTSPSSGVQRERLERQAHFDELTRLPNRARLTQLLAEAMRAADRDGYLLAVCYLDLDRFKPVNDRYGHDGGDRLLVELAGRLRGALRSRDLWADAAARLGGDEFVLLLRAGTLEEARLAVERVLRVVGPALCDRPGAGAGADHGQRGRHGLPDRPQRRRHPAAPRRPRDVRRQAVGSQRLPVLRPRAAPPHRGARDGHRPRAGGAGPRRVRAVLPADRRHAQPAACSASRPCCAGTIRSRA